MDFESGFFRFKSYPHHVLCNIGFHICELRFPTVETGWTTLTSRGMLWRANGLNWWSLALCLLTFRSVLKNTSFFPHIFLLFPTSPKTKIPKIVPWVTVLQFLLQWVAIFRKSLDGLSFSTCRWGLTWPAHIADSSRWDYDWEFVNFLLCLCQCHEASGEEIQPVHFWTRHPKISSMFII